MMLDGTCQAAAAAEALHLALQPTSIEDTAGHVLQRTRPRHPSGSATHLQANLKANLSFRPYVSLSLALTRTCHQQILDVHLLTSAGEALSGTSGGRIGSVGGRSSTVPPTARVAS